MAERESLYRIAERYAAAKDVAAKRKHLVDFLGVLQLSTSCQQLLYSDLFKQPVRDLQEALLQLNHREQPALFEIPKTGRPPLSRDNTFWRAVGSALITILMDFYSNTERQAAEKVIKAFKKHNRPLLGKSNTSTPTWKLLQSWRDKCIIGEKGERAREIYTSVLRYTGHHRTRTLYRTGTVHPPEDEEHLIDELVRGATYFLDTVGRPAAVFEPASVPGLDNIKANYPLQRSQGAARHRGISTSSRC